MNRRALLAGAVALTGCGYHAGTRADLLPPTIKTIAIPTWGNVTTRYRLSEQLPAAISREFISRTRYRVIAKPEEADAILTGAVVNFFGFPNVTDPNTSRAVGIQVTVVMQCMLTERATGKVLYNRPSFEFRQRYEIAVDQARYFEESDVALERLSRDVARSLVSSVLEAF